MKTKKLIITIVYIVISLGVFYLFPINGILQKEITLLVFFIILPAMFNKFILKKKISSMGIQIGDWKQGLIWSGGSLLVVLLVFFVAGRYFGFLRHYNISALVASSFLNFIFYEFVWVLFSILLYDFFFRGFIMFNFIPWARYWAILIQAAAFLVLVIFLGSSVWPFAPFLVFAPFAGLIAYKSRSILYSSGAQLLMFIVLDATVIRLAK